MLVWRQAATSTDGIINAQHLTCGLCKTIFGVPPGAKLVRRAQRSDKSRCRESQPPRLGVPPVPVQTSHIVALLLEFRCPQCASVNSTEPTNQQQGLFGSNQQGFFGGFNLFNRAQTGLTTAAVHVAPPPPQLATIESVPDATPPMQAGVPANTTMY